ncbi:metallopeptidase [Mactra antiquata]
MPRQHRTSTSRGTGNKAKKVEASIPYASGFSKPSVTSCQNAIGYSGPIPHEFDPSAGKNNFDFFPPIPNPSSVDDWLAQYCEEGQTYKQFLNECPWLSSRKRKYMSQDFVSSGKSIKDKYPNGKVYILPVGQFSAEDKKFFPSLIEYIQIYLGLPVGVLNEVKLDIEDGKVFWVEEPEVKVQSKQRRSKRVKRHQLTSRFNLETEHLQVGVDSNLFQLRNLIPDDAICMIGLTMLDLFGENSDLFVAGMAAGNQRVAIFSLYRYDPCLSFSTEHWFQIENDHKMPHKDRQRVILQRGCKLVVHEICHLLGIDHCIFYDCCMNGSGHLSEDFRQPMHLCPVDLRKLHSLVGFNVLDRYRALLEFYKTHGFSEEQDWVKKRIEHIQS